MSVSNWLRLFTCALVATAAVACGDDTTNPTSSGSGGSGGGAGGAGGAGGGAPAEPTCDAYCDAIMANCKGDNAQYSTKESCMGVCAELPVGKAADQGGNTLGCRIYHAGAAKSIGVEHCEHAGPGGAGLCGDDCEGFCAIAAGVCPDEWSAADCEASCANINDDVAYSALVVDGDSLACRTYHLSVAATSAADATTHCPHTVEVPAADDPCAP